MSLDFEQLLQDVLGLGPVVEQVSVNADALWLQLTSNAGDDVAHLGLQGVGTSAPPLLLPPALELEGVVKVKVQGHWNAEVHGHVLDVLCPVCGIGSQLLHLIMKDGRGMER